MTAPNVSLSTTGTDPKIATEEDLEGQINAALQENYDNIEAHKAETSGQQAEINAVSGGLSAHVGDEDNPHGIRASHLGVSTDAARGQESYPLVGVYTNLVVNESGEVLRADGPDGGPRVAFGSSLIAESFLRQRPGPLIGDFASIGMTDDRRIAWAHRLGGGRVQLNASGAVEGQSVKPWGGADLTNGRRYPAAGVDLILIGYGQSLAKCTVDAAYYETSTAYNTVPVRPGQALMPNFGHVIPFEAAWDGYVDLVEGKHPTDPDTVETFHSEMARELWAQWAATFGEAAVSDVRTIHFTHAQGGSSIRRFQRGSDNFRVLMEHVSRAVRASRAEGRTPIVGAVMWVQGEADRADPNTMTAKQRARELAELQAGLEAEIKSITGQSDPVPMLTPHIQRNNDFSGVIEGTTIAADVNPGAIFLGLPNYALEYNPTGGHPSVSGYRRMGNGFGKVLADSVFGVNWRSPQVVDWYQESSTELVVEVELLLGGALVMDVSGDLIDTTELAPSYGWAFEDKSGAVAISGVSVAGSKITIAFSSAPDWASLRGTYGHSSAGIGEALGGMAGPRGPFRDDQGVALEGLTLATHNFLLPASISMRH